MSLFLRAWEQHNLLRLDARLGAAAAPPKAQAFAFESLREFGHTQSPLPSVDLTTGPVEACGSCLRARED